MTNKVVKVYNVETSQGCKLNIKTGEKKYRKRMAGMGDGLYFKDKNTFFALYATGKGPVMYYERKEYPLKKDLHISVIKKDSLREFFIEEYKIHIKYHTSVYLGWDAWSQEEDVDLFYQIEQSYKKDEYYEKYTKTNNVVKLHNIEIYEKCKLNIKTGKKKYRKRMAAKDGLYFKDKNTFFALYATEKGPVMYYEGKEYPLKKDLHLSLIKNDRLREFFIEEYKIHIKYHTSVYVGWDVWSQEEDVDLFYQIEQSYKKDEYYEKFTK